MQLREVTSSVCRPPSQDLRTLRDCMGEFVTGVCVVTSEHGSVPAGMTVNSFTSVSLNPPVVLVCLTTGTRTLAAVIQSKVFWISVLDQDQRDVALAFARKEKGFPFEHVQRDFLGGLTVPGSVAWFWCNLLSAVPMGDHHVLFGRVVAFRRRAGHNPLVFHRGRLAPLPSVDESHESLWEGAAW